MQTFSELDSEKQQKFYSEILKLKEDGLGYKKIIKNFKKDHDVKLSLGTLSYWFNNDVQNIGGENCFIPKANPELSYVLGVMFGDGSLSYNKKKQEYSLALRATDKDFVEKFANCGSKILDKDKDYSVCYVKPRRSNEKPIYATKIHGKKLYNFVKEIKENFKKGKELIKQFPAEFIQGLADSEGCPSIAAKTKFTCGVVVAYSANHELLQYTKKLLINEFDVSSNFRLGKRKGDSDSVMLGRVITRTMDLFSLSINKKLGVRQFARKINFSILRKKEKLEYALCLLDNYAQKDCIALWTNKYQKIGKQWVKRTSTIDV